MKVLLVFLVVVVAVALCADYCDHQHSHSCKCPHGQSGTCSSDNVCHCHAHIRAAVNCTLTSDCHGHDADMHHCDHGHHKECVNGFCKCQGHH